MIVWPMHLLTIPNYFEMISFFDRIAPLIYLVEPIDRQEDWCQVGYILGYGFSQIDGRKVVMIFSFSLPGYLISGCHKSNFYALQDEAILPKSLSIDSPDSNESTSTLKRKMKDQGLY